MDNPSFAEPEEKVEDLVKQEAWVGKIQTDDRFGTPLSGEVEREPSARREGPQAFAASVHGAGNRGSDD